MGLRASVGTRRRVVGVAVIAVVGLAATAGAASLPYKTGTYRNGLSAQASVKRGSFKITIFSIRDEQCTPTPPIEIDFNLGNRGYKGTISGKISSTGKLSGTGHVVGTQKITGRVSGRKMTLTVNDHGPSVLNGTTYQCHGSRTAKLSYTPGAGAPTGSGR